MANIKSQIRRNIKNKKQNEENRKSKSKMKTLIKKAIVMNKTENEEASKKVAAINEAVSYIDSCLGKHIIKKNTASRYKSKVMKSSK